MSVESSPSSGAEIAATTASVLFHARSLARTYIVGEVEVRALKSVTLDLYEGEFAVILGASGSGKSTLLNLLGGLDVPSGGRLFFRNWELTAANDAELTRFRRDCVGFIFQLYNLIPSLTAQENVALATELADRPLPAREALAMVGLADERDRFPSQLSGGQQQRVAIARAIAKRPEVLLCDEPTGALDVITGKRVLSVLDRINREFGTTIITITHNAAIAAMADRAIAMRSGEIASIHGNETKASPEDLEW